MPLPARLGSTLRVTVASSHQLMTQSFILVRLTLRFGFSSCSDSQSLLVTFIFKFRIQRRILDGAHFQGMDACLFALQYLRSAPGAFGSSEVYDMSECTTISAAVLALSISHKTFTIHHHFWAMVRHSTTSERYEHKWKTHVAGGYKCLGLNFEQHVFPGPMAMPKPLRLQHLRWEGDEVTEIWTRVFENKG